MSNITSVSAEFGGQTLTIEFEERMYAAGKIPGGYIKREGRASENATLSALSLIHI